MIPQLRCPTVRSLTLAFLAVILLACSDQGTGPKKELEPLVGTWTAEVVLLTNKANPAQSVDIIAEGATFTLSILATGTYTATLQIFGTPTEPQVGTIQVSGNQITIAPTNSSEPPTTGTWSRSGDRLFVDGDTEFDFNLDGTREASTVHMEFVPLGS